MGLAPIALFVYNRPFHTLRTLEHLEANFLASNSEIYIHCDGAKPSAGPDDLQNIQEVRKIIRKKKWCGKVNIIESAVNLGLADSIIGGVTNLVNQHGKIIVLEDDMVTSKWFLKFMNDFLNIYEPYEEIISATGYIYPVKKKLPEIFFLKGTFCWSWATWKRGWDIFEPDGKKLLNELNEKNLAYEFDFNGSYYYTQILKDQIEGKNDSWALRWHASAFLKNKMTLLPGNSLVQNIGNDGSGIHCTVSNHWETTLNTEQVHVKLIKRAEDTQAKKIIAGFFSSITGKPEKSVSRTTVLSQELKKKIKILYKKLYPFNLLRYGYSKSRSLFSTIRNHSKLRTGSVIISRPGISEEEFIRLQKMDRYVSTSTSIFGKEIKLTDAASFLFMYDEIFNKQIYKFQTASPSPYIIDCGANIGLSIIYFKQLYPGANVLGFEPDPNAFEALEYNIRQFELSNVEIKQKGVWDRETILNFFAEGADGGRLALPSDKENICEIKTERLKEYLNAHVDFLKIDIEGAETTVLKDCADVLKNVDRIFIEYHSFRDQHQELQDLLRILNDSGFRYNIQHIGVFSPMPFVQVNSYLSMDNQLNIFAYR